MKFAKFRVITHFFPRQAIPTSFWLYTVITLVILNTELGSIWATPWLNGKQIFLKFSKIHDSRNSQNSVWKIIFPRQDIPTTFLLYTLITLVILNTELGLIWATPWPDEKQLFLKFSKNPQFVKFAKFRVKTHFFPRQAIPTTFLLYALITLVILNTELGLIWATPWPDEKQLFLKFSKIRNSWNSQNSVW